MQRENDSLKAELNSVRELLKQQENIIIELYAKSKSKSAATNNVDTSQLLTEVKKISVPINGKNTVTSLTSYCSSSSRNNDHRAYIVSNLDARESIEESNGEDE